MKRSTTATPIRRYAHLLGRYLRPQWKKATLMALLILAGTGLQLLVPQIIAGFIDTARAGGALSVLVRAALFYLMAALANQLFSAGATYAGADVGWTATNAMRADLALHCLKLDMAFHTARTPGELIERIDGDITALSNFFSQFAVRVIGSALLLVGILVVMWFEYWPLGLGLTVFSIAVFVALNLSREVAVPATKDEREASARLFGFIEERLAGIDDIRANGGGPYVMNRLAGVMRDFFFKGRKAWMRRSTVWLLSYGLFTLGDLMTLGVAVTLFGQGAVTLGAAYMFFQYMLMLEAPIEQITQQMQELQRAGASIGRIDELFGLESGLTPGAGRLLPEGPLAVQFDSVGFAYEDHAVLSDISFELAPATVLGLLGRTGSGKTTLTRLLFRLYEVGSGAIRLGGVDLRDLPAGELHRHVGMVTQEVQLFRASVRDNLTFFDPGIPDERILEVLCELGLDVWLSSLPQGLDSELHAGGGGLSAGEAQLLAFARVFLKDPGLVIMDEPSSRLDPATEALLERAVSRLLVGRTAIIIAHRLGTVRRADEIMVMEAGRILEHGPREALAADPASRFHRLLRAG
ncbi:MAG TPA: ABC transporter ATP-binding protein, partial [Trueperaceae bacterium]